MKFIKSTLKTRINLRSLLIERNRIKTSLKRRALNIFLFDKFKTISIKRLERSSSVDSTGKYLYHKSFSTQIFDPRNELEFNHSFNSRMCFEVRNVILEPRQGLLYSRQGQLIIESSCWTPNEVFKSYPWVPKNSRNYSVIEIGIPLTSSSYYHWLIEDLPATIFAGKKYPGLPFIVSKDAPAYVKEFAQNSTRETIYVSGPQFMRNLVFVEKHNDSGWPNRLDINELLTYSTFREAIYTGKPFKKYYISRKYSRRSPRNEPQIENLMLELGFDILYLESMRHLDQIKLISQASCIAGVHGAGHANTIWMKSGTKVIDIVNENYWTEANHRLTYINNQIYLPFLYQGKIDNSVNLPELRKLLEKC